jgi:hypothetical protein
VLIRRVETLTGGHSEPIPSDRNASPSRLRIDHQLSRAYWLDHPLERDNLDERAAAIWVRSGGR